MPDTTTETVGAAGRAGVQTVVDWLVDGARTVDQPQEVLDELCTRLLALGLPLHRVAMLGTTLHPDVLGRRFLWQRGGGVQVGEVAHEWLETDGYLRSPLAVVRRTGVAIRLPIASADCPAELGLVEELRAEGVTDYLMQPLPFTNGEMSAIGWATTRPGGFGPGDMVALETVCRHLAQERGRDLAERVDLGQTFTAIGPAVNLTARLETLARDLGRDLVVSAAFARHAPDHLTALGSFDLEGFRAPHEVFAPSG